MSIEAMKQAIEAIEDLRGYRPDIDSAIETLRAAIQQAEARTDVRCEGCGYMTHHREHMGCVRAAKQFTHPAPGVPDGWSDRHTRVAAFALRRFADASWERSDEAAQKSYMGNPSDYKAFQSDAKDAEDARAILLTASPAQKGQQ